MNLDTFRNKLNSTPEAIEFTDTMNIIEQLYDFTETAFNNGHLKNVAGENSGSCKLFYFARLQKLDQQQSLACFGSYYRDDVIQNPDTDNHQNIRNFMKSGWDGIKFSGEALKLKEKIN